jgi:hypothetical protein
VDPEGEAAGRRQGCGSGWEEKKGGRKKKGPAAPGILSESRHAAWRDSVAPGHVARLTRHLSSGRRAPGRRGASVAPGHVARLNEESRHTAWRDQKGYFLQF